MSNANAKLAAALKPGQIVKMTGAEAGMGNVKSFMESQRANLAAVLPKHVDADRMLKLALGALRTTPKLLNCNVESLMGAVVTCATLGLEPNTPLGHAYLIPFENRQKGTTDVQIVFGYKGAIEQHILQVNGIDLSLYSAGPAMGRPIWLLHGFPECWHSWRQQIEPLAAAGYRVLIPEMRGYGQSSAPRDPAAS